MSIWRRICDIVGSGSGAVSAALGRIGDLFGDPVIRRQVAFSIALIALSAKMAKADGIVTADEVAAFRQIFAVPESEDRNVTRLFDQARRDVTGFESYAQRIASFYGPDRRGLEDVMDGLFAIAKADDAVHEAEYVYLKRVAAIFGFRGLDFEHIASRHVVNEEGDPYLILGLARDASWSEIRSRYRGLASENHPDKLVARGVPPEFIAIAGEKLAAINYAFERIERERRRFQSG